MNRSIYYDETRKLEEEDMGYESPLYKISLYDKPFLISIGRERKLINEEKKHHYYFPVYLMNQNKVQTQIGVFEYESNIETQTDRLRPYLDENGDVDLNTLDELILYGYATEEYFDNIQSSISVTPAVLSELETQYLQEKTKAAEVSETDKPLDDTDLGVEVLEPFELNETDIRVSKSMESADKVLQKGVFDIDKTVKRPLSLQEETKGIAKQMKKEYVERKNPEWIEKFMKNNHYDIVDTENNGDCLFDTVRIAYEQIGYKTTIQKLRAIVAKELTDEIYTTYRDLYQGVLAEKISIEKNMRKLVAVNKELKLRLKNIPATEKEQRAVIVKEANLIAQEHKDLKEKYADNENLLGEFKFMKNVDSLDQLRDVVQTPEYWADNYAISILERELNMKFMIFSELNYDENDLNNVLQCTSVIENTDEFSPDFYVFTTYSGNHYRLITYKNKRLFRFAEIPYDVKIMVVIKCMEKNSGIFNQIQDFRNFKSKLGVDTGITGGGSGEEDDTDEERQMGSSIDKSTVFSFYNKSASTSKAGKGDGEKISPDKSYEYSDLDLKKHKDWRKKLDDDWGTVFHMDNMKWNSVEHYYQGAKFKKHNPHFYKLFSVGNDFDGDVELAKAAGSQTGMDSVGKVLRPSDIKIDPDFYGNRQYEEREQALYAKFSQNDDLKQILLLTKNAVLKKHVPKTVSKPDYLLMKVRDRLQKEEITR
jgi:hypothetical protein